MSKIFLIKNILLIFIIFLSFFYFFELKSKSEKGFNKKIDYVVESHEDGFSPQKLTIQKGETVMFITTLDKSFWPASNLHPSHGVYPEFDSTKPITPDKNWIFQFNQAGEWNYHDHLASLYGGTIVVIGDSGFIPKTTREECQNFFQNQKIECLEEVMGSIVRKEGIDVAFDILDSFYTTDSDFSVGCHEYTHTIGQEAYLLFAENREIDLTTKTSYCGYGFYHGFMETLLYTTGDINEANDFCNYVNQKLGHDTSHAGNEGCYHGIGHGVVDGSDSRAWGDAEAMIKGGLEICKLVGITELKLHVCANGAYNALANMFINSEYNLSINKIDPFWICKRQFDPDFKKSCYRQMTRITSYITKDNFLKSLISVMENTEEKFLSNTIASLTQRMARFYSNEKYFPSIIDSCRTLPKDLHNSCVGGFVVGIIEFGPPQEEYIPAANFCKMSILTEEERRACLEKMFNRLVGYYSLEKYNQLCLTLDEKDRSICLR